MSSHQHTPPPTSTGSGRRGVVGVARAIAALLVLAAALAGIPALLLTVAPIGPPTELPSWTEVGTAVTSPDRGQLLLGALTVVAWVCWFVFALSAVVEVLAVARGLPTPRLPGLALPQGAAAALVAGAAVLLAPAQLPAARPAVPVVATATAAVAPRPAEAGHAPQTNVAGPAMAVSKGSGNVAGNVAPRPHAGPKRAYPTVTVLRGDTLWQLAEHHLGSGTRFREIAKLNYGRTQPDGSSLTDAHRIYPGWILRLPHHATGTSTGADDDTGRTLRTADGPNSTEPRSTDQHARTGDVADARRTYLVRAGDTLWDIAQTHLGDGARYRDLFTLNAERPQPDGQALHDPALILPGWQLRLPPRHGHHETDPSRGHPAPAPPRSDTPEQPEPVAAPAPPAATPTATQPPRPAATATPPIPEPRLPHQLLAPLSTQPDAPPTQAPVPAVVDADDPAPVPVGLLTVGVTALAAAGIITELARRRHHQQRRRPTGTHIAMPTPDSPAHVAERALRIDMDTPTLDLLRAALARITSRHVQIGATPPRIALIAVNLEQIELTLDPGHEATAAAMTPFTRHATGAWTATRTDLLTDTDADADSGPDGADLVYPALLTLGATDDAVVLANLEAAGTLSIHPATDLDRDRALPVLRALAFELATSPLTATCSLSVSPELADLAAVTDPSRLHAQDPAAMAAGLHARTTGAAGGADLLAARAAGVPDAGNPQIYLSTTEASGLRAEPWSGCATIAAAGRAATAAAGHGWALHLDGDHARLEPYGLALQPQRLTEDTYRGLLDLLSITSKPAQQPAPLLEPESEPKQPRDTPAAVDGAGPQRRITISEDTNCAPPRVHVLGPVRIEAAGGRSDNRKRRITELITYLALHPDAPAAALDDVLWNGRRVSRETRNSLVYRARTWLGDAPDGTPYLPHAGESGRYRLHPALTCDWHDFQHHIRNAATTGDDEHKVVELQAALDLVQDRPFLGVDPAGYIWAEHDTQAMISAIVDTAHQLATLRLQAGNTHGAQDAAAHGLFVDPVSELLYRDALTAAQARSDVQECQRLEQQLRARLDDVDPDVDLEPETLELLSALAATR